MDPSHTTSQSCVSQQVASPEAESNAILAIVQYRLVLYETAPPSVGKRRRAHVQFCRPLASLPHSSGLSRPAPLPVVIPPHRVPTIASSPPSPAAPPLHAETLPGVPEAVSGERPKKGKAGKNLTWSPVELLALAETAPTILEDAAVGSGQTAHKMGLRIRARILESAPARSGTEVGTSSVQESLRRGGRSSRECKTRWDMVKAACSVDEQVVDFLADARVPGNPKPEQLQRCHQSCFNAHQDSMGMVSRTNHVTAITLD